MRIGFDIGGVLSKYPNEFRELMKKLYYSYNAELYIITDMHPIDKVIKTLNDNGFFEIIEADQHYYLINPSNVYSADYETYGNAAKAVLISKLKLDMFFDDFDGYLQWDSSFGPQPILLKVQPDMFKPYWSKDWVCDGGDFGRRKYTASP